MYKGELQWVFAKACGVREGGKVVEVGTFRGRSAAAWCQGLGDRATLYCVDPWDTKYPESSPVHFEVFKSNMQILGFSPEVLRMPSIEAVKLFEDKSLDVVFLDGNHKEIGLDLDLWGPKVMPGGTLCGHDWRPNNPIEAEILKRYPEARRQSGSLWEVVL